MCQKAFPSAILFIVLSFSTTAFSADLCRDLFTKAVTTIEQQAFISEHMTQAKRAADRGHYREAVKILKEIVEIRPNDYIALTIIGVNYMALKEYGLAVEYFEKTLFVEGPSSKGYANLFKALYAKSDYQKASEIADTMMALNPKDFKAVTMKAQTQMALGQLQEALKSLDVALAMNARDAVALGMKAKVLFELARIDEAYNLTRTSLSLNPKDRLSQDLMTRIYIHTEQFKKALAEVDRHLLTEPTDRHLLGLKIQILIRLNRMAEADAVAILIERDYSAQLYTAKILMAKRKPAEALKLLTTMSPSTASLWLQAEIYFREENYPAMQTALTQLLQYSKRTDLRALAALIKHDNAVGARGINPLVRMLAGENIDNVIRLSQTSEDFFWDHYFE